MTAKEMSALQTKFDRAVKNLDTAINMLPQGNYRIGMTKTHAVELKELLYQVAQYFDWKLENTEVRNDVSNKRRSKRKRK